MKKNAGLIVLAAVVYLLLNAHPIKCNASNGVLEEPIPPVKITSPHPNLEVTIDTTWIEGKNFGVGFTIINRGETILEYVLFDCYDGCYNTTAYAETGRGSDIKVQFGGQKSYGGYAMHKLQKDVPVKAVAVVYKFDKSAKYFSSITVRAACNSYICPYKGDGYFVFENIPIDREKKEQERLKKEREEKEKKELEKKAQKEKKEREKKQKEEEKRRNNPKRWK